MAKVVVAELNRRIGAKQKNGSVTEKRIRDQAGQAKTLRTLDAGSATFGEDLRYVFAKNVEKARRDNKRVTGATDIAPRKR
jgi:hypothetical protein